MLHYPQVIVPTLVSPLLLQVLLFLFVFPCRENHRIVNLLLIITGQDPFPFLQVLLHNLVLLFFSSKVVGFFYEQISNLFLNSTEFIEFILWQNQSCDQPWQQNLGSFSSTPVAAVYAFLRTLPEERFGLCPYLFHQILF